MIKTIRSAIIIQDEFYISASSDKLDAYSKACEHSSHSDKLDAYSKACEHSSHSSEHNSQACEHLS